MKHFTRFKSIYLLLVFTTLSLFSFGQKYTGLTATASDGTHPTGIFDGNLTGIGWQDATNLDNAWIVIDLGSIKNVNSIKIYWEAANAKDYKMSFSTDNSTFTGELSYTGLAAGNRTDLISGLNIDCRYIKMQGVTRQLPYGYAMFEFEVYPAVTPALTSLSVTPTTSSILLGATKQLTCTGLDQLGNAIAFTNTTTWSVDGTGASVDATGLFSSTSKGFYTVTATNTSISKTATIEVLPVNANLSIATGVSATATASSPATGNVASFAFDNNGGTRWETATTDPQWIMVNLGGRKTISDIIITWEFASGKDYVIEGSLNGTDWTPMLSKTNLAAGARTDRWYDINKDAQYVRLTGTARTSGYGYSIWEFKIYGTTSLGTSVSNPTADNALSVYPNPASDYIYPAANKNYTHVTVYSLSGQMVKSGTNFSRNSALRISDLAAGNYIVKLVDEDGNILRQQFSKK